MDFTTKAMGLMLSGMFSLILAAFVYWKYRKRRIARIFATTSFFMAGYCWLTAGLASAKTEEAALLWLRIFMPFAYWLVAVLFHFTILFSRTDNRLTRGYAYFSYAMVTLLTLVKVLNLSNGTEYRAGQGWFPAKDPVYEFVYGPYLLLTLLLALFLVIRKMFKIPAGSERNKLAFFFLAIGGGLALDTTILFPKLDFLGAFSTFAFTSILTYAITRHRLFDLSLVVKKGAFAAGLSFATVVALIAAVLKIQEVVVIDEAGFGAFSIGSTALLVAILLPFFWTQVSKGMNRLFDVRVMSLEQRLLEYTSVLDKYLRPDEYLSAILKKLGDDMGVLRSWMMVRNRIKGGFLAAASQPLVTENFLELRPESILVTEMERLPRPLDLEELLSAFDDDVIEGLDGEARKILVAEMNSLGAEVALPVQMETRLEGILLLSKKASDAIYSARELEFLQALCVQLARALENSQLHVQVQQADRLSTLGVLSASLAHELRNPLTSISTFVQMMPTRYADEAFREKFSRIVGTEMSKLVRLTEQLLSFAKPSQGQNVPMNLVSLCDRVRQLLKHQFSTKGVDLNLEVVPGTEGSIMGKESELSQVFINLLLNAMQATAKGGAVVLKVWEHEKNAFASVTDTGSGMTPEQLKHIFDPFYTTKEDGTGLGLPTCLRVVEQHQGNLSVTSSPGQGSCFVLRLPLKQGQESLKAA